MALGPITEMTKGGRRVELTTLTSVSLNLLEPSRSLQASIGTDLPDPTPSSGDRGGTVVKVLCYKSEGRWFDPSWCHWNFSLT